MGKATRKKGEEQVDSDFDEDSEQISERSKMLPPTVSNVANFSPSGEIPVEIFKPKKQRKNKNKGKDKKKTKGKKDKQRRKKSPLKSDTKAVVQIQRRTSQTVSDTMKQSQ